MTNLTVINQIFDAINDFKRSRILADQARKDGDTNKAIYYNLREYRSFDSIELLVRRLQANERYTSERTEAGIDGDSV